MTSTLILLRYLIRTQNILPLVAISAITSYAATTLPMLFTEMLLPILIVPAASIPLVLLRVTTYEASLPIPGRDIVRARMLLGCMLTAAPFLSWIVTTLNQHDAAQLAFRASPRNAGTVMLYALGCVVSGIIVPNIFRRGLVVVPRLFIWVATFLIAAIASILWASFIPHMIGLPLFVGGPILAFVVALRATPDALLVAPTRIITQERFVHAQIASQQAGSWWRPLVQSAFGLTLVANGFVILIAGASAMWLNYFMLFGLGDVTFARPRVRWLRALPLSNGRLTAYSVLPTAIVLVTCLVLGRTIIPTLQNSHEEMDDFSPDRGAEARRFSSATRISVNFWYAADDSFPTPIVAPWGETGPAHTITLYGRKLYNPYSALDSASKEFINWQFQRATTAAHGTPISRQEYRLSHPPPLVTRTWQMQLLIFTSIIALLLVLNIGYEIPRSRVFAKSTFRRRVAATGCGVIAGVAIILDLHALRLHGTPIMVPLLDVGLMRLSSSLPGGAPAALLLILMLTVILWWTLTRLFAQSEYTERVPVRGAWEPWWQRNQ